jgi:hypothetical protein
MTDMQMAVMSVLKNDSNNLNIVKHTAGFLVQYYRAEYLY